MELVGSNGSTHFGGFSFASVASKKPEIDVIQPASGEIIDDKSTISLGKVKIGKAGQALTFTIKNTGSAPLRGIAVSKSGANKQDFVVSPARATSLARGTSTKFTVKFRPKAKGTRTAAIKIVSNDNDESQFDIKLTGSGLPK